MPLLVGSGTPPVVVTPPPTPVRVRVADIPTATWTDPTGFVWPLTDTSVGWFTPPGLKGVWGTAPVNLTTADDARGGVTITHAHPGPRIITWPLFVEGRNHGQFLDRWRALANAFAATRRLGPGWLTIARPDGSARRIPAVLQDGFDGEPDFGIRYDLAVLTLLCPKPWFLDLEPTPIVRAYTGAGSSYLSPYPNVSSSQTLGSTAFVNPGGVEVWPDVVLTGPAATVTAENSTRGESWTLDVTAYRGSPLVAGEKVRITSDPPAVTGPDGTSWYGALETPGSTLWRLDPGRSDINLVMGGASAGAQLEMSFYGRHETP